MPCHRDSYVGASYDQCYDLCANSNFSTSCQSLANTYAKCSSCAASMRLLAQPVEAWALGACWYIRDNIAAAGDHLVLTSTFSSIRSHWQILLSRTRSCQILPVSENCQSVNRNDFQRPWSAMVINCLRRISCCERVK
jgi:hypothetical protein